MNGIEESIATRGRAPSAWTERLAATLVGNDARVCRPALEALRRAGRLPGAEPAGAAVLIALLEGSEPGVLLTRRHDELAAHPGQVAFPGGAEEPGDASAEATALREAEEEVGLAPARVRLLGRLPRYPTTTGYLVTPVVAHVAEPPPFIAQASEVADIFVVPLSVVLDDDRWEDHPLRLGGRPIPHRELHWGHQRIWGATAGMLQLLLPPLREARGKAP